MSNAGDPDELSEPASYRAVGLANFALQDDRIGFGKFKNVSLPDLTLDGLAVL
jgi:hypothetical protein